MNVADRIQSLRRQRGLSQEQLADAIGVSRQLVSKWENEQALPDMERIIILSDYFNTTTDYLLKGIEPAPAAGNHHKNLTEKQIRSVILDVFLWAGIIYGACNLFLLIFYTFFPYIQGTAVSGNASSLALENLGFMLSMPAVWIILLAFFGCGGWELYRMNHRKKAAKVSDSAAM